MKYLSLYLYLIYSYSMYAGVSSSNLLIAGGFQDTCYNMIDFQNELSEVASFCGHEDISNTFLSAAEQKCLDNHKEFDISEDCPADCDPYGDDNDRRQRRGGRRRRTDLRECAQGELPYGVKCKGEFAARCKAKVKSFTDNVFTMYQTQCAMAGVHDFDLHGADITAIAQECGVSDALPTLSAISDDDRCLKARVKVHSSAAVTAYLLPI